MLSAPSPSPRARRVGAEENAAVPCIRLFSEPLLFERGGGFRTRYGEVDSAVIQLCFDYGGVRVRCSDPVMRVFRSGRGGMSWVDRNRRAEAQAQYLLESFGAVEIGCLSDCATAPDSDADYLVHPSGDVHVLCSFSAYALPQLRALGWRVEIDPAYPYQLVEAETPWYAEIESEEQTDWFGLELGVEVGGRRINLLPALLELIDRSDGMDHLDALARAPGRCFALPTGDGRYLPLPAERLRTLVRVLLELYQGETDRSGLRFSADAATALVHLDETMDLCWGGEAAVRDRGRALSRRPAPARTAPPSGLQATMRPYQQAGLAWLQNLREHDAGGVLADDMGLGKTLQAISHLMAEKEAGLMDLPSLVVAPTSLVGNWMRELGRFAPSLRCVAMHGPGRRAVRDRLGECDVVVTTYGVLARDAAELSEHRFHLLILDEAQAIKNRRSQTHQTVKAMAARARHRLCLSGTPVENDLDELWSLFEVLMPGFLGTPDQFRMLFRHPIEKLGSQARLEALRERVAPYILRRMKEDVAPELPPKTEIVRPVALGGAQRELYESIRVAAHADVRTAIRKKGLAGSTLAILDALMKLRQVCCDPRLVRVPSARLVRDSAKYDLYFELLRTQLDQGRRVLVFSQFTSMLGLLSQGMRERGIDHVILTGATANRQKVVDTFQEGDVGVFLISLKAGGTGLNLTRADTVIHYDPWWNPAAQAQATDRAYRIGQTRPVFVYSLIAAGSVEERMLALQQRKRHLADTILGQGSGGSLDPGELDALFAPLADE
jgi:superfamily II DNA or RNA helicase